LPSFSWPTRMATSSIMFAHCFSVISGMSNAVMICLRMSAVMKPVSSRSYCLNLAKWPVNCSSLNGVYAGLPVRLMDMPLIMSLTVRPRECVNTTPPSSPSLLITMSDLLEPRFERLRNMSILLRQGR